MNFIPWGKAALPLLLAFLTSPALADPAALQGNQKLLRRQTVAPLPGGLDQILVVNDNNPELISGPGILLSTFPRQGRTNPGAHLDVALNGRFDLFSHHVFAGKTDSLDSTLWLGVIAAPRGPKPVNLRLIAGSTALSQSVDGIQPGAPFLPLPALMRQESVPVYSGPGSRVATELLMRQSGAPLPEGWTLPPGQPTSLLMLPIPVRGLDPLLNGRNLQLRLESSGPISLATLAAFGENNTPPGPEVWRQLLEGDLSPKEHAPSPRGTKGPIVYSRVSGVQVGSTWTGRISDPGKAWLSASRAPISWPISSLERGSLGTGQVQTAELKAAYPATAWAAHGNYGIEYDLSLPLRNDLAVPVVLELALESPLKSDAPQNGLRFNSQPSKAVMFRGTVEVLGLDNGEGRPSGRQRFHLVERAGSQGPVLGQISLAPKAERLVRFRLIYPADATPPQVLSLLPVVKQSELSPADRP
ncbi:DUF3370 domain-containing protein [Cyanobium sp. WAJ14-Wanaka]|uniref:DUF3370 domain-containing protein n=1 Tax=Cyanobium sp. WAJ14-Wanaka TaxID=2823725 RepID=UPI0020CCA47A|nr:DUF3370 domain-containing protein [Cyanobium sp. WAJ14-Wanaka]MCP9774186.1 DUF3370 domain-containing protein [Cyanobium sp. WAJ14-Wanaka]